MAISDKEAAIRTIERLPDDASTDDIMYAMYVRAKIERGLRDIEAGNTVSHEDVKREIDEWLKSAGPPHENGRRDDGESDAADIPVNYHLEREGWATVLVPDRPVPPITTEMVNDLIEEMRREREESFLGPDNKLDVSLGKGS